MYTANKEKYYTVFSLKLAGYLMQRGFNLIAMGKNEKDPSRNVFFFRDSVELQDAINTYSANKKIFVV